MADKPARFYYKGDRLKPLKAFCQAARLGSVSRAAEALFLSQPAVTLQLQALERDLGVALFERIGRRLSLTREGTVLYELARPLIEGLDGLDGEFRSRLKGLQGGELHVAAGSSTILYLLPPLVQAYREALTAGWGDWTRLADGWRRSRVPASRSGESVGCSAKTAPCCGARSARRASATARGWPSCATSH